MEKRRVVITGLGTVNPLGNNVSASWDAAMAGKCGIGPITQFDASEFKCKLAGEVKNFDPETVVDKKEARKMARFTLLALAAGRRSHCGQRPGHRSGSPPDRRHPFQRHRRSAHHRRAAHPRRGKRDGEGQPLLRPHVHREHGRSADRHPLRAEGDVHLPGDCLCRRHQRRGRCLPPHP